MTLFRTFKNGLSNEDLYTFSEDDQGRDQIEITLPRQENYEIE